MKLNIRKTLTVATAVVALTAGTVHAAPAFADEPVAAAPSNAAPAPAAQDDQSGKDKDKEKDNSTSSKISGALGSSETPKDGDNDGKSKVTTWADKIGEIVKLIGIIASLFTAVVSMQTAVEKLAKNFAPRF
ncbi:hypothetical protein [Corynebacterium argentoratense]|jgi:hypothetical protein|uniref:hypothetical protein n=1 Tax=Corynebacterium argentoratense TaxID=42817 RepID=UPI001F2A48BF|nr:hypothetical protein [Corynebacterium argentoratense]MCF1693161.1 hypothetical protein [Corynebacterium argentoratense]MCF1735110.1 hypothetical protein [Corynebacterium argentoratense]